MECLREQAAECRRFATADVDGEIVRKINALADEYIGKAVKAEANAACKKVRDEDSQPTSNCFAIS